MSKDLPAILTNNLSKIYSPSSEFAVNSLNMKVEQGEIFGFLGPNGAGKTTTIRLLLDLIRPTSGHANILGLDCNRSSEQVHQKVGYLPGELKLYPNMNGRKLVKLFTSLRPETVSGQYVSHLCKRLDVDLDTRLGHLSHGNRQKVGLVLALMPKPDLLILDEPTTGLDPLIQHELLDCLKEFKSEGRTVFFSSHILSDVEQICDRVGIIRQGHLIKVENVQGLRDQQVHLLQILFAEPIHPDVFLSLPGVRILERTEKEVNVQVKGEVDAVIKAASHHHVISIKSGHPSLDDIFKDYYQNTHKTSTQDEQDNA